MHTKTEMEEMKTIVKEGKKRLKRKYAGRKGKKKAGTESQRRRG